MKKSIFVFAAIVSIFTNANAELNLNDVNLSPFQVLKNAFNNAEKAEINDFPKLIDFKKSNLRCVSVGEGDNNLESGVMSESIVGRFSYVVKGKADNGPLFPGTPDKIVTTISGTLDFAGADFSKIDSWVTNMYLDIGANLPVVSRSASGDLQATITSPNYNDYLITITYRKSGSELFIHEATKWPSQNKSGEIFSYCYQK